jgi:hypothetical protein
MNSQSAEPRTKNQELRTLLDNASWHPYGDCTTRNIAQDNRIGSDHCIVANMNGSQNFGASAYINPVTDTRCFERAIQVSITDRNALPNDTVVTYFRAPVDDDPVLMFENDTLADLSGIWQFDTVSVPGKSKPPSIDNTQWRSNHKPSNVHSPNAESVDR